MSIVNSIHSNIYPFYYQSVPKSAEKDSAEEQTQTDVYSNRISAGESQRITTNDWEYTRFQISNSLDRDNKEKLLYEKVNDIYDKFNNGEISIDKAEEELNALNISYQKYTAGGFDTLRVSICSDEFSFEDFTVAEINKEWLLYFDGKKDAVQFAQTVEHIKGVENIEIKQIESMEYIDIKVNGEHMVFMKAITNFVKDNLSANQKLLQRDELLHKGFTGNDISIYFIKNDRGKKYTHQDSYQMKSDIKINGKIIKDIFELQDEIVFKRASNNIFSTKRT